MTESIGTHSATESIMSVSVTESTMGKHKQTHINIPSESVNTTTLMIDGTEYPLSSLLEKHAKYFDTLHRKQEKNRAYYEKRKAIQSQSQSQMIGQSQSQA